MRNGEAEAAAVAVDNASVNGAEPVVDTTLFTRDSAAVAIAAVGPAEVSPVWTVPADDARDWGEALALASGTAADRTDVAAGLELLVEAPEEVGPTGSAFASVVKDLSRVPGTLDELVAPTAGVETGTDDDVSALGVTDAALAGCCEVAAVATMPLVSAAIEVSALEASEMVLEAGTELEVEGGATEASVVAGAEAEIVVLPDDGDRGVDVDSAVVAPASVKTETHLVTAAVTAAAKALEVVVGTEPSVVVGTVTVVVGPADEEEGAESAVAGVVEASPPVRIPETVDSRFAEPEVAVVGVGGAKDVVVVGGVRDD